MLELLRSVPVGEQLDRRQAEDEAADVRPVGDALAAGDAGGHLAQGRDELEEEPDREEYGCRDLDDRHEEDDEQHAKDPRSWIEQQVSAQHARYGPARADRRRG